MVSPDKVRRVIDGLLGAIVFIHPGFDSDMIDSRIADAIREALMLMEELNEGELVNVGSERPVNSWRL